MGSEDEAEQSLPRPCRQKNGRSQRTCELTSSIVPRGTFFHRTVELTFPPIGCDLARLSCRCRGLFPGPAELGAVNPDAVHDHRQPACQRHDRLFHPAAPGDLHRPGFEPGPFLGTQHGLSCFARPSSKRRPCDGPGKRTRTKSRRIWCGFWCGFWCGNENSASEVTLNH
jgi:hypothetical protein